MRMLKLLSWILPALSCAGTVLDSTPGRAADFYAVAPAELAGKPGTIIRKESLRIHPVGSRGHRILYRSTGLDGRPIAVSGIVLIPEKAGNDRPIVAWSHATTGVAAKCGPSLSGGSLDKIPGLNDMLNRGYVVVATDYPGLGLPGPHSYLVGISEGRAVLDSVRAVHNLDDARAGKQFAVWGHSQGGHAALFAGELASSYAPELRLAGVAAAAPASELAELFEDDLATFAGHALTALTLNAWSSVYQRPLEDVIHPEAVEYVRHIGAECITGGPRDLLADLSALHKLKRSFLISDPVRTQPWDKMVSTNTPGRMRAGAPVFLAQGNFDKIVDASVTRKFAAKLCRNGTPVRFFSVPEATHEMISHSSAPATISWMAGRFANAPPPNDCRN